MLRFKWLDEPGELAEGMSPLTLRVMSGRIYLAHKGLAVHVPTRPTLCMVLSLWRKSHSWLLFVVWAEGLTRAKVASWIVQMSPAHNASCDTRHKFASIRKARETNQSVAVPGGRPRADIWPRLATTTGKADLHIDYYHYYVPLALWR